MAALCPASSGLEGGFSCVLMLWGRGRDHLPVFSPIKEVRRTLLSQTWVPGKACAD